MMFKRFTYLCSLICLLATGLAAQESRGQIIGRVSDPSGAVIPGATVRAVDAGTNVATNATTSETGDFTLAFLVAGDYEVLVEAQGFKKFQRKGIAVRIQDSVSLNVTMQIGSNTESVEVTTEPTRPGSFRASDTLRASVSGLPTTKQNSSSSKWSGRNSL
jgi:Carboxypeptidase regulatory-like domain